MMERPPHQEERERRPRDAAYWARHVETLKVSDVPEGAVNLNVDGRRTVGPLQGFGKMWQKTYYVRLEGASVSPTEVVRAWRERFPDFWAPGNRFLAPSTGISLGGVALINKSADAHRQRTKTRELKC